MKIALPFPCPPPNVNSLVVVVRRKGQWFWCAFKGCLRAVFAFCFLGVGAPEQCTLFTVYGYVQLNKLGIFNWQTSWGCFGTENLCCVDKVAFVFASFWESRNFRVWHLSVTGIICYTVLKAWICYWIAGFFYAIMTVKYSSLCLKRLASMSSHCLRFLEEAMHFSRQERKKNVQTTLKNAKYRTLWSNTWLFCNLKFR